MQSEYLLGTRARHHGAGKATRHPRSSSLDIPEEFAFGPDAEEDVTAPRTRRERLMNQSFFSVLANAGTQADLYTQFDVDGSDIETKRHKGRFGGQSLLLDMKRTEELETDAEIRKIRSLGQEKGRGAIDPALRSVKPPPAVQEEDENLEIMTSSQILSPPTHKVAPKRSPFKMGSHEYIGQQPGSATSKDDSSNPADATTTTPAESPLPSPPRVFPDITERLVKIFELEGREELVAEYPCWLLQSVLLQGHMYVLQKHICFYARLSPRTSSATKTGYLSKRGNQTPKYTRYWFVLKGEVLSYFSDPSDPYFPSGSIDLRLATSVDVAESKDSTKALLSFSITTDHRVYRFRADSTANASEWVKQIRRVMFRSHHDGENVKIKIEIDSIMDIEDSPVIGFAENLKIRVLDNETFAVDEYFFSFLETGHDALEVLKIMTDNNTAAQTSDLIQKSSNRGDKPAGTKVEASRDPDPEPRAGMKTAATPGALTQDGQTDAPDNTYPSPVFQHIGLEAAGQPSSTESEFSDASNLLDDDTIQASQILQSSGVFQEPTISRYHDNPSDENVGGSLKKDKKYTRDEPADSVTPRPGSSEESATKKTKETPNPDALKPSSSNSRLQDLMRAGSYPLQKASGIANILSTQSKRMGSRLASESLGYYEKVANMWAGKQIHYEPRPLTHEDHSQDKALKEKSEKHGTRFRNHFALPESEKLQAAFYGWLQRVIPVYGKLYISNRTVCFRNLFPGTRTKMILPLKDIENVDPEKGFQIGYHGLVVSIRGHEELFFEFRDADKRDDCAITLIQAIDALKKTENSGSLSLNDKGKAEAADAEYKTLFQTQKDGFGELVTSTSMLSDTETSPVMFDDPTASILSFSPDESMNITCLTIGSRGDVQPYIALCKGLLAEGHKPTIATHPEFREWIEFHGIKFAPVAGDPKELMRICIDNDMFTPAFFRETWTKSRGWIDELLRSSWKACQGAQLLIESPSAMGGIHIAEALKIPYFRAFSMSWTRTRAYPHAFAVPVEKRGGLYNLYSYAFIENVFWGAISAQINHWRTHVLQIGDTSLDKMQPDRVPFLYQLSPAVVPRPLDYSEWIHTTGFWFLDEGDQYTPPEELANFIAKAKEHGKKLVYIGFGSITMPNPEALTKVVVDSVVKADVRCILSKGWSDRRGTVAPGQEAPLPDSIHRIRSVPHDWLFRQMDAAVHHGGAGTTGASLRAGIPTIIKPFFGDQFFYGSRVETMGVGIKITHMNTTMLARALWIATHDERMLGKARALGEQIRKETGVETAIQCIYRDLEYAKSYNVRPGKGKGSKVEALEDSWSVISSEDEDEIDNMKRIAAMDTLSNVGELEGSQSLGTV